MTSSHRALRQKWERSVSGLLTLLAAGLCLFSALRGTAQVAEATPDEILVGMRGGRFSKQAGQAPIIGRLIRHSDAINVDRIKIPAGMTMSQALTLYRGLPGVEFAEQNHIIRITSTPNDPMYANQYGPRRIQADKAWDIWTSRAQVVVAIVDTGVDSGHPDLTNKILRDTNGIVGWNAYAIDPKTGQPKPRDDALDDFGHGTHCSGIAAAQINDGTGIAGIAGWDGNAGHTDTSVKIMPVKVLQGGAGTDSDVADGITWAADHGARIISMSLGDTNYSGALDAACTYAWNKGCLIVAAAGNNGSSALFYPAANSNVLSVAATDSNDALANFSNYGSWVNVAAPGVGVFATLPTYKTSSGWGTNYGTLSGTSMATPHVAGEAALLLAAAPTLTNPQLTALIENNVDPYIGFGGRSISATGGRINAFKALATAIGILPPPIPQGLKGSPNGANILLNWQASTASSFNLYRSTTSGSEGHVPYKTGLTGTAYTDSGVLGQTYYYQLSAVSAFGETALCPEIAVSLDGSVYQINAGGGAVGSFAADSYFAGGKPWSTAHAIDLRGAANPAPMAAYQTLRANHGPFSYAIPGLTAGSSYKVRLHFEEPVWNAPGKRLFSISANGGLLLSNFDVYSAAGGMFKAAVKEFTINADTTGSINLMFVGTPGAVDPTPFVCAVEVLAIAPLAPATPTGLAAVAGNKKVTLNWMPVGGAASYNIYRALAANGEGGTPYLTGVVAAAFTDAGLTNGTTYFYRVSAVNPSGESAQSSEASATPAGISYQINAGGGAVGSFAADSYFAGGKPWSTAHAIDLGGAANPAPMAAYQTLRANHGPFSYAIPGLTAGSSYKVRLHFEEPVWNVPGKRLFSISANGAALLTRFDVYSAAGAMFKAVVKEFTINADTTGSINLTFVGTPGAVDPTPFVCAIEVHTL